MKIFKKVHCKAYLKKESDGVFLRCTKEIVLKSDSSDDVQILSEPAEGNTWRELIKVEAIKYEYKDGYWHETMIEDLSSFEGSSVEKQYRTRIEEEFDGFLVGITYITTNGRIGTTTSDRPYNMNGDMEEIYHLTKETQREKVGVVYFKNNAKRYVLLEDMEEVEE